MVLEEDSTADAGAKRKREEKGKAAVGAKGGTTKDGANISAVEVAALARREAARQRVAQRTAAGFGYL